MAKNVNRIAKITEPARSGANKSPIILKTST
jgi:hypothetical protein